MYSFVINICSLSFELLPPHGSGRNYCQSLDQATATGKCSTFHMIAILHGHYINIHAFASKRTVVCTRTIYLPPTLTSQFSTLTCGLVKSTTSLAEDAILFHANHIEVNVTFHFYLYRVSELNTHKYLRERSERIIIMVVYFCQTVERYFCNGMSNCSSVSGRHLQRNSENHAAEVDCNAGFGHL